MDSLVSLIKANRPRFDQINLQAFRNLNVPKDKGHLTEFYVSSWINRMILNRDLRVCEFINPSNVRKSAINGHIFSTPQKYSDLEIDGAFSYGDDVEKDFFYEVKSNRCNGYEDRIEDVLKKQRETTYSPSGLILFMPFFDSSGQKNYAKKLERENPLVRVVDLKFSSKMLDKLVARL